MLDRSFIGWINRKEKESGRKEGRETKRRIVLEGEGKQKGKKERHIDRQRREEVREKERDRK